MLYIVLFCTSHLARFYNNLHLMIWPRTGYVVFNYSAYITLLFCAHFAKCICCYELKDYEFVYKTCY